MTASVNLQGDIFPVGTHNLGSQATPFDGVYANKAEFGDLVIDSATNTISSNTNAIVIDPAPAGSGGALTINGNTTVADGFEVTGLSTVSNVVPDADNAKDLGSSAATWKDVYANKVMLGDLTIDGSNNTISSATNSIVIDPAPSGDGGDVTIAGNILILSLIHI